MGDNTHCTERKCLFESCCPPATVWVLLQFTQIVTSCGTLQRWQACISHASQGTSLKLRPVVAGYRIDSLSFLSGPMMKTARAVRGMPALSISSGSSMPYLKHVHKSCISQANKPLRQQNGSIHVEVTLTRQQFPVWGLR